MRGLRTLVAGVLACLCLLPAGASEVPKAEARSQRVMSFSQIPHSGWYGKREPVELMLEGEAVQLVPDFEDWCVRLCDADGDMMYQFELEKNPNFTAYKIGMAGGKEALLLLTYQTSQTNWSCSGLWLIGKSGGEYRTYTTLEKLRELGLIGQEYAVFMNGDDSELWLQGKVRIRDCYKKGTYGGHAVYADGDPMTRLVNAVSLYWDEEAEDFGIVYHDEPLLGRTKVTFVREN